MTMNSRLRCFVDISKWNPYQAFEGEEVQFCLQLLPKSEQQSVLRFVREDDKKRALVSRLLQRFCIQTVLRIPWPSIQIERTKGQKPFLVSHDGTCPNFNYNVSHEGLSTSLCITPTTIVCLHSFPQSNLKENSLALQVNLFALLATTFLHHYSFVAQLQELWKNFTAHLERYLQTKSGPLSVEQASSMNAASG